MRKKAGMLLLLTPFLLLMLIFLIGMGNGLLQSFGVNVASREIKPTLHYYRSTFSNPELLQSIGMSLWISIVSSVLAVVIGTWLCVLLIVTKKTTSYQSTILKIPMIMPHLIVGLMAILVLGQSGVLARFAYAMGLITTPSEFPQLLYDAKGFGIILAYLWKEIPFVCFYVMTIMSNVSHTYQQAAMNLGASSWQSFFYVTLPLCKKSILHSFLILFAFSFGAYELPYLLGPTMPKAMPVQAFIEYTHPDLLHRPYAMVLNALMIGIGIAVSFLYYRLMFKKTINKVS